jgi:fatty-acyl-CoA synthase
VIGEILIKSPFLFDGYYLQPVETARALRHASYHTADLGFLYEGEIFVTGRQDDLVTVYGRNYYAHDIEAIASTVVGVIRGRCCAFAVASKTTGTNGVILIAETDSVDDVTLVRRIRETVLGDCGLAINQVLLKEPGFLVKTTSGKMSREANRSRFLQTQAGERHHD